MSITWHKPADLVAGIGINDRPGEPILIWAHGCATVVEWNAEDEAYGVYLEGQHYDGFFIRPEKVLAWSPINDPDDESEERKRCLGILDAVREGMLSACPTAIRDAIESGKAAPALVREFQAEE